ncbi:hypothetical protein GETHPA_26200 [Geothrix rubra]|uniref:PH domain-containing protein n=1 Tax=Geothrix rubra TaxID=2927977 RepID=A0ABQ5Q8Z2_9BACT|nr:hypothetical protein [Geothrix rubra]GLH71087.1 hypothetical protein GETHPA_26200 [Geothrix rubra]
MPESLELKLEVSRGQRLVALVSLWAFLGLAFAAAWEDWHRGRWGGDSALMMALRLLQAVVIWQGALRLDAKVLVVQGGILTVTTQFRKPFGLGRLDVPIREAALEWIGPTLVIQTGRHGGQLRLGRAPAARSVADWLVARGAPPPVGG